MVKFLASIATAALVAVASAQNAAINPDVLWGSAPSTPVPGQPTLPHWVGPIMGKPIDNACYRKTYRTRKCPPGYQFDKVATCWAECPLEYPVECGMECLPQNSDCALAIIRKITSVGTVALNAATSGVFGKLADASKGVKQGVLCGQQLFTAVNKVVGYIKEVDAGQANVDTTKDQLMYLLSKSDLVVIDLPNAVATCTGLPVPTGAMNQANEVVKIVKLILDKILSSKSHGQELAKPETFLSFARELGGPVSGSVSDLKPNEIDFFKKLVGMGVTCGSQIKTVIDKVVAAVGDLKRQNPNNAVDVIRFAIMNSDLLLKELPDATVGCFNANAPDGFKKRDDILKTIHVIIDRVIEASSQNGNPISIDKYAITVANMGLDVISMFDPTGLAQLAKEFIQPICGPTVFIGDIDDGPADKALGLTTVQKAFRGSSGQWTKTGDGMIRITFRSVDDKDVKVNIKSGGDRFDQVKVGRGQTVMWERPLSQLQGKTLYMDRWRPGFLGIPGTGGGSLLAWVPMDADGGLQLNVQLNPTTFFDKNLRA